MTELFASLEQVFAYLEGSTLWWGLLVLALCACVEYIFPPFPGDSVTLAGAVLIPQAGWPISGVFGAVMAGTAAGVAVDWRVGMWLGKNQDGSTWLHRWMRRDGVKPKIDKLIDQFERHGPVYLVINRFVPAFRALFFVAAGLAKLSLKKTLLWGCMGAALWNGVVLGVGYVVGYNLERLAALMTEYTRVFWAGLVVLLVMWGGWKAWQWWQARGGTSGSERADRRPGPGDRPESDEASPGQGDEPTR